jgi:hypothetical protein
MARNCWVGSTVLSVALVSSACSQAPGGQVTSARIKPTYDAKTRRLQSITYDRNGDGAIDAWTYMDGTKVVRAELDENYDGRTDRWEYYKTGAGESRAATAAALERVESSSRQNGVVTRREWYENGAIARAEEDTDGDSQVDKWEQWQNGVLVELALDTHRRGRPDRRIIYGPDGSSPRFEVDPDGSGQFRPAATH